MIGGGGSRRACLTAKFDDTIIERWNLVLLVSTPLIDTTITDRRHRPLSNSALNSKPKTNISASD